MRIAATQLSALVGHAREEAPNECCGYLRAAQGRVEEVFPARNLRNSRYGYELDPQSLLAANELDDAGYEVGVYHSHPRSAPEPSQTDINLAHYPHWTYLIVSLAGDAQVRAWRIFDGRVEEEELAVVENV
ncbi:MAG: M67 family metallopeptidase [Thermoleophilaceae bacterium]|nr:M67 family metallopeptidase [Thermoleophilaceae bacterium]